jgi:Cohesin domain
MTAMLIRIALAGALGLLAAARPAEALVISTSPGTQAGITSGSTVAVTVSASGLGSDVLGAYDVSLGYSASLLAFIGVSFGTALGDPSLLQAITSTGGGAGVAEFADVSLLTAAQLQALQPSTFPLATLSFQAIGNGTATFSLASATAADAAGRPLPVSAPIPEPCTALLLGIAAGLGVAAARTRPAAARGPAGRGEPTPA